MNPEKLTELANRIDHEELWRRSILERDALTLDQRDRLDAGIALRRYASGRMVMLEALKEGREFMRGFKLVRADDLSTDRRGCGTTEWHRALNAYSDTERKAGNPFPHWMYTAKMVSDEVPRLILLFERERKYGMPDSFKMCGHDPRPATKLQDNHLRCGLGKECRKCPHLAAIDEHDRMTAEAKDEAKAWTCATHILLESGLECHLETLARDKSDDAFDEQLHASFAAMEQHGL